ncbi:unnamed protein product, partial [Ectocarpus sp. 8 AP-2014]
ERLTSRHSSRTRGQKIVRDGAYTRLGGRRCGNRPVFFPQGNHPWKATAVEITFKRLNSFSQRLSRTIPSFHRTTGRSAIPRSRVEVSSKNTSSSFIAGGSRVSIP